jgi:SAM pointed domain-containing ETS transcription factor
MSLPLYTKDVKVEPEFQTFSVQNTPDTQMDVYKDLLRRLMKDIDTTCQKLSLPTGKKFSSTFYFFYLDPNLWTSRHVYVWACEMSKQFPIRLPSNLNLNGAQLMQMSRNDFAVYVPNGADTLHDQFQLWKTAFELNNQQKSQPNLATSITDKNINWNLADSEAAATLHDHMTSPINSSPMMSNEQAQLNYYPGFSSTQHMNYSPSMVNQHPTQHFYNTSPFQNHCVDNYYNEYPTSNHLGSPSNSDMSSSSSMSPDEFVRFEQPNLVYENNASYVEMGYDGTLLNPMLCPQQPVPNFQNSSSKLNPYSSPVSYNKVSSGTIHLWHFIRELLDQPKEYASCVRWVDRKEGTFKIESSNQLARAWGLRKNRSAMNYDKLSRSLRQYYKKGIIQKPEKKQRLVYKFLPPYNH